MMAAVVVHIPVLVAVAVLVLLAMQVSHRRVALVVLEQHLQ